MTRDDWFALAFVFGIMAVGVLLSLLIGDLHD